MTHWKSTKLFIGLLIALLIVTGLILVRLYMSFAAVRDDAAANAETPATTFAAEDSSTDRNRHSNPQNSAEPPHDYASTQAPEHTDLERRKAEQEIWENAHGYRYSDRANYIQLTDAELSALAKSGDISAMHYLAARSSLSDPQAAIQIYEQAAVYGSTYALIAIADLWLFHDAEGGRLKNQSGEGAGVRALTYSYVAELRGNNIASGIKKWGIITEYGLDDSQITLACEEAKKIYKRLQSERISQVGTLFDNAESPLGTPLAQSEIPCR